MLFKVTQIEFDFTTDNEDDYLTSDEQIELQCEVIGGVWEADDADDLIDILTSVYGWCIKSIDYVNV